MNNVKLNTGAYMPAVGFGVFKMSDPLPAERAMESALELGYRHIDTARFYDNEEAVGKAVRASGIPREELFVTTKLWNEDQRNDTVAQALEGSLKRLDIDYIDLYLVHWPVEGLVTKTWTQLETLYAKGQIKALGVSNHRIQDLDAIIALGGTVPAVNQIECYPYFAQNELVQYCAEKGIIVEAWGPLGANKIPLLDDAALADIALKHSKSTAQIILRWNIQRGIVPLPKSQTPSRQEENLEIFDFALDAGDMAKITALDSGKRLGPDPANVNF